MAKQKRETLLELPFIVYRYKPAKNQSCRIGIADDSGVVYFIFALRKPLVKGKHQAVFEPNIWHKNAAGFGPFHYR